MSILHLTTIRNLLKYQYISAIHRRILKNAKNAVFVTCDATVFVKVLNDTYSSSANIINVTCFGCDIKGILNGKHIIQKTYFFSFSP